MFLNQRSGSSLLLFASLYYQACYAQGGVLPLLSTISRDPELSSFYSILKGTGGTQGIPGPAIEERFNSVLDGRNYTAFVPTNEAFSKIPTPFLSSLATPQSYELLLALIRTHIAEGTFPPSALTPQASNITSIEGFQLTFRSGGTILNEQATVDLASVTPAANGLVYKIDTMLDPFAAYFGISASKALVPGGAGGSNITACGRKSPPTTITDILTTHPSLSTLVSALQAIDPDFLTRLSLTDISNSRGRTFFAPSNAAFTAPLLVSLDRLVQPSNQPLSSYLLRFGLVEQGVGDEILKGERRVVRSISGFNITVGRGREGVLVANNAGIEEAQLCACNGCVWIVGRMLDPVYRALG